MGPLTQASTPFGCLLGRGREVTVIQSHGGCSTRRLQQEGCRLDKRQHFQAGQVSDPSGSLLEFLEGCLHATLSACTWDGEDHLV